MCLDRRKNHGCGQKKPEGTSSAIFGIGTAAKYCDLKRCADRGRSRLPTTKMKSSKANLVTLTFCLPPKRQLSILLNFFFPFIDIWYFPQVLNFTSVELNRFAKQAKLLQKNLFFKSEGGHAISRPQKDRLPKSTARFSAKKRRHSPPPAPPASRWIVFELPSPSPRVCTGRRRYADVTIKISRIERLPNLLSNGAPLAR